MTSSWRSSALKTLGGAILVATIAGCGEKDGLSELAAGRTAYEAGEYEKAVASLEAALEYRPSDTELDVLLASANFALGNIEAARSAATKALAAEPDAMDIIELVGKIAFFAKDTAAARESYQRLTDAKNDPQTRSRGYAGMGAIDLASLSEPGCKIDETRDRARTELLLAVRLDGRNAAARYHLGQLYREAYHYNEIALDQYVLYSRLGDAKDPRVQRVVRTVIPDIKAQIANTAAQRPGASRRDSAASAAALKKAEEATAKKQYKTARQHYEAAYKADVLNYNAAVGLARACLKDSERTSRLTALKYFQVAGSLRPSSKDVFLIIAKLATDNGNHALAVEAYSRALAASPSDLTSIDGLIRALNKTGNKRSAAIYQKYRDAVSALTTRR